MHLATSPDRLLTTRQIAEIHGARYHHMTKVTGWLVNEGYAQAERGRNGGLRLALDPSQINLGTVMRKLEADKPLVECLAADGGRCSLSPACGLASVLVAAQDAFFLSLDAYTLETVTELNPNLAPLLSTLNHNA
jgi:Rrf2 family nitric oxide-sensitive transcriptional repressor